MQKAGPHREKLPAKETQFGKRDGTLTLTVGVNAYPGKDGDAPADPAKSGQTKLGDAAVEETTCVDAGVQVEEDSLPGFKMNESDLSADENFPADSVLLCVEGCLNGIAVVFLIDSGASECFVGKTFAEKNGLKVTKTKN